MIAAKKVEMGGNAPCCACRVNADKAKGQYIHVVEIAIDRGCSSFPAQTYLCLRCARRLSEKLAVALVEKSKKPKPPPPDYTKGSYRCDGCHSKFHPKGNALQIICPKCKHGLDVRVNYEKQG